MPAAAPADKKLRSVVGLLRACGMGLDARENGAGAGLRAREEVAAFDPSLLERPSLLVANKLDLPGADANLAKLERAARRKPIAVSTADGTGLDELKARIRQLVKPTPPGAATSKRRVRQDHAEVSAEKLAKASFLKL